MTALMNVSGLRVPRQTFECTSDLDVYSDAVASQFRSSGSTVWNTSHQLCDASHRRPKSVTRSRGYRSVLTKMASVLSCSASQ